MLGQFFVALVDFRPSSAFFHLSEASQDNSHRGGVLPPALTDIFRYFVIEKLFSFRRISRSLLHKVIGSPEVFVGVMKVIINGCEVFYLLIDIFFPPQASLITG